MTEINCLKNIETQHIDVNTRYSVCERGGSEEGHLGEGQGGKTLMAQRGVVLSVENLRGFIEGAGERCSPVEISIL